MALVATLSPHKITGLMTADETLCPETVQVLKKYSGNRMNQKSLGPHGHQVYRFSTLPTSPLEVGSNLGPTNPISATYEEIPINAIFSHPSPGSPQPSGQCPERLPEARGRDS